MYSANQPPSMETFTVGALPDGKAKQVSLPAIATMSGNFLIVTMPGTQDASVTDASIALVSPDGRTIRSLHGNDRSFRLDCPGLANGVYFVKIASRAGIVRRTLVVDR
jgi:hypothetical protein